MIAEVNVDDAAQAVSLARALTAGGLRVLEVELLTPAAFAAVEAIRKAVPEAVVGVGALLRPVDFAGAGRAGAQFGVTPGLTPELAAAARGARFPVMPGIMTPTDVLVCRQATYDAMRFFPAEQAGGAAMLRALAGTFAEVLFCPSGGITYRTAQDYLAHPNVPCVGASWVAPADLLEKKDWRAIEALAGEAAALKRAGSIG